MMVPVHFTVVINFVLALIPFILALYLFKLSTHRSVLWWILAPIFILFLPNSAYVLTDIIHFFAAVKSPDISRTELWCVYLPFYILFLSVNFEFYVLSVKWSERYIQKCNVVWLAKIYIPLIHFLCALGVYLGRFQRLESADILHNPLIVFKDILIDLTNGRSELIILGLFFVFYVLYNLTLKLNQYLVKKYKTRLQKDFIHVNTPREIIS